MLRATFAMWVEFIWVCVLSWFHALHITSVYTIVLCVYMYDGFSRSGWLFVCGWRLVVDADCRLRCWHAVTRTAFDILMAVGWIPFSRPLRRCRSTTRWNICADERVTENGWLSMFPHQRRQRRLYVHKYVYIYTGYSLPKCRMGMFGGGWCRRHPCACTICTCTWSSTLPHSGLRAVRCLLLKYTLTHTSKHRHTDTPTRGRSALCCWMMLMMMIIMRLHVRCVDAHSAANVRRVNAARPPSSYVVSAFACTLRTIFCPWSYEHTMNLLIFYNIYFLL